MFLHEFRSVETHLEKNMLLPRPVTALVLQLKRKNENPPRRLQNGNGAQTRAVHLPGHASCLYWKHDQNCVCLESLQIFKLLLSEETCDLIMRKSECCAAQHNETIKISKDESYTFVANILFLAATLDRVNGNTGLRMKI